MTNLLRDARIGFRLLGRNRGFTAVAVLTIGIGIAANTAIFSVIYATYLEPLPYRDPERLVMVWSRVQSGRNTVAAGDFIEWKRQATVFEDLNAWSWRSVNLATDDRPEQVQAGPATPGFLPMLGYGHPLALGRDFLDEEGTVGRDRVVILSHRLWQERFGGDPRIVGRDIRIDGKPHTVVGVLGAGPADRNQNRLWLPLAFTPEQLNHDMHWLLVMGRLKPGVTVEQANANMAAVSGNLARIYPSSNTGWSASVEPFRNNFVSDNTKKALWLLVGAVAFVLLIACANVANLLLARGTARQRELAVRASLGASRGEIVRQLIIESVVLAFIGGALGALLASAMVPAIVALMPPYTLPTEAEIRLNMPALIFTLAACGLSGLLFGCAPAWQAARTNVNDTLKEAGRSLSGGGHGLRRALVVLEFALALTLLAGGGLAIHSFFKLTHVDLGFRTDRLLTFSLPVERGRLTATDQINTFYRELIERVQGLPGIISASVSTGMPLRDLWSLSFHMAGAPATEPSQWPNAGFNMVTPDYFKTFGVPITRGRGFTDQDRPGGRRVAIVSESFVRRYIRDVEPLGQRVMVPQLTPGVEQLGRPIEWEIVGVHADVRYGGPQNDAVPVIYVPFWQSPWPRASMAVRTAAADPTGVQQSIAAVIRSMDADLPMGDVTTVEQIVSKSMAPDRFNTVLFGSFAAVALLLATIGIYGVMSFVVAQRTHEIGIRMALGAGRARVLSQVLREGMITALAGVVIGSAGAYFVVRAMRSMAYGVSAVDATWFVVVVLALVGAAFVACLVPAGRAASVDPMAALRQE